MSAPEYVCKLGVAAVYGGCVEVCSEGVDLLPDGLPLDADTVITGRVRSRVT